MGLIGCYNIHLYCDHEDTVHDFNEPDQFNGATENDCISQARKEGWLINKNKDGKHGGRYYCLCPLHSGKKEA